MSQPSKIIPDDLRPRIATALTALNTLKVEMAGRGLHLHIDRDRYDADDPTEGRFHARVTLNDYVIGDEAKAEGRAL